MRKLLAAFYIFFFTGFISEGQAQVRQELDDHTRAALILDISRYVTFDAHFDELEKFRITVMDTDDDFYWPLARMAAERKFIQGKPVEVTLAPRPSMIKASQVVYLNSEDGYKIKEILWEIEGQNTLLVSEGYPFKESMINFVVVDGKPRFEANEQLMKEYGLSVDALFLAQAIKTQEDWEQLYEVTDEELQVEKEITHQQEMLIMEQDSMINAQLERLKALGSEIVQRARELGEKNQALDAAGAELAQKNLAIVQQEQEMKKQRGIIASQQMEVAQKAQVLKNQQEKIRASAQEIAAREAQILENEEKISLQLEAIQKQKLVIYAAILAVALLLGLAYFIFVNYRNKKKANELLETKNRKITAQRDEIEKQKELAESQRDQIAYQKKHITDSIHYAQKIQSAILPSLELFTDELDHFVLYKPRDIVSGDFYWVDKIDQQQVIIAADCTGHGVPGAFMSMLGVTLLNEIILNRNILSPEKVLENLRSMVIDSLGQVGTDYELKDGMDMTVTVLDFAQDKLFFAGANNPLYHIRKGVLTQYKGDKMPVAIHERMEDFHLVTIDMEKGDTFYTFSDGYVDQFGGPKQKKFLSKNFRDALLKLQELDMMAQGKRLDDIFENYRRGIEQVDDVVVIGVRY